VLPAARLSASRQLRRIRLGRRQTKMLVGQHAQKVGESSAAAPANIGPTILRLPVQSLNDFGFQSHPELGISYLPQCCSPSR
jgi:hypothetical protein